MQFYLETNAIRALANKIKNIDSIILKDSFTSFLVIFELLSGTTEDNFKLRHSIVSDIINSCLYIDWRSPVRIISESFTSVQMKDTLGQSLEKVTEIYIKSKSWEDTCNQSKKLGNYSIINTLKNADKLLTLSVKSNQEKKGCDFRCNVDKESRKHIRNIIIESKKDEYMEIKNHFHYKNCEWLLIDAAATVAIFLPGKNIIDKINKLLITYNGSIDYYINASAFNQAKNLISGSQPGDNDYYDISHLLYINRDKIMVSDDKLVNNIFIALWPSQIYSIAKYKLKKNL